MIIKPVPAAVFASLYYSTKPLLFSTNMSRAEIYVKSSRYPFGIGWWALLWAEKI